MIHDDYREGASLIHSVLRDDASADDVAEWWVRAPEDRLLNCARNALDEYWSLKERDATDTDIARLTRQELEAIQMVPRTVSPCDDPS
jgi:hypothetical protein